MEAQQLALFDQKLPVAAVEPNNTTAPQPLNNPPVPTETMKQKPITLLQGMFAIISMPTEERLSVTVPLTDATFSEAAKLVEDTMKVVDENWKIKSSKGRKWKGAGARITENQRERIITLSPFASSILNMFKTLRKKRADAYHRHCVVLGRQEETNGYGFQQNINILPYGNAPGFVQEVEELNASIDKINEKIREFQQSPDWQMWIDVLDRYGVGQYLKQRSWTVGHASTIFSPLALEPSTVKQHVEKAWNQMFLEIDQEKAKQIQAVQDYYEKGQMDIVRGTLEFLKAEMGGLARRIVASAKRKPERVKEDLERLHRKVVSIGMEALEPTVIQLKEVFDNPDKAFELFGTKDVSSAVEGRVKGLIDSL